MPAIQEKLNLAIKNPDVDNLKAKGNPPTKHKNPINSRRAEADWERLSQPKRRVASVPESELKPLLQRTRNKRTKPKDEKTKRDSNSTTSAAKLVKKRQWDAGNAYSKVNLECQQAKFLSHQNMQDEFKTSRSLYCDTPKQKHQKSLLDLENINPQQLPDNFLACDELDEFFRTQFPDFESSSDYDYQTAQLFEDFDLPSEKSLVCSKSKSPGVLRHFKELLQQEESSKTNLLGQPEIGLLKDIVKADERHQKLKRDDYNLLKEILMAQLEEIENQERVIKIALKKIRSRNDMNIEVTTLKPDSAEQPMEEISKSKMLCTTKSSPKHNSDIIFKDVPSLQKEIKILRSLGLKLEETLKKSEQKVSARENKTSLVLHTIQMIYFRHCSSIVTFNVTTLGIQYAIDLAQEFQIRHQTIDELKLEREFFIPTDCDNFTLQRTNFGILSRNPDILFRRLKPCAKDTKTKFNIIEQNPIFFNHFITKLCKVYSATVDTHETYIPTKMDVLRLQNGAGDHPDIIFKETMLPNLESPDVSLNTTNLSNYSLNKKKRQKRRSTPLNDESQVTSKNKLLKLFVLGTLQLSIMFIVLSFIFFTDATCL